MLNAVVSCRTYAGAVIYNPYFVDTSCGLLIFRMNVYLATETVCTTLGMPETLSLYVLSGNLGWTWGILNKAEPLT
jgi:hypothetical protein